MALLMEKNIEELVYSVVTAKKGLSPVVCVSIR